jgi:riboflavin biosynthesis pyrimidine reductase
VGVDFAQFVQQRERRAQSARIGHLVTDDERPAQTRLTPIGNDWTRSHYAGDFWLSDPPADLPATSLVFVQSREGNTGADDPGELGGGDTDLHLIYEGLSRVAADAVLAGARTASGNVFFSVWHPELVALRESLGLPRHPVQIVVSRRGHLDIASTLLFNVPDVPVILLAGSECRKVCGRDLSARPWISVLELSGRDLAGALRELRSRSLHRISCVGGRTIATDLLDAALVQDVYLTTADRSAGEPGTPFYAGTLAVHFDLIVRKRSVDAELPRIVFEHLVVRGT